VPAVDDPAGIVVRSMVHDIISLYEVNRKDAATLLLELPRWFKKGTFRDPKPAKRANEDDEDMREEPELVGPQWSLETIVVEVGKIPLRSGLSRGADDSESRRPSSF
jgi:nuclear cap-binding protein subunit 1